MKKSISYDERKGMDTSNRFAEEPSQHNVSLGTTVDNIYESMDDFDVDWVVSHLTEKFAARHRQLAQRPAAYRHQTHHRIFVNRAVQLEKIRFFGFDMDHTLAEYVSPEYEALQFELAIETLIKEKGYPAELRAKYNYDHSFALRGVWIDRLHGNTLKVDQFGRVLVAFHGFQELSDEKIRELYPTKSIQSDPERVYVLDKLYNYGTVYVLACLVNFVDNCGKYEVESTGVRQGDKFISYKSIYLDGRYACAHIHTSGVLRERTLDEISKYLVKDDRLPLLLQRLRQRAKVFVLTNSDYNYTNAIMTYLLGDPTKPDVKWNTHFDYVIVSAKKPQFFTEEKVPLMKIDMNTGKQTGESITADNVGSLVTGHAYSGGSCDTLSDLMGAKGSDVLFMDDQIFSEMFTRHWRIFLVVPELHQELLVWTSRRDLFQRLHQLDKLLADAYMFLDSSASVHEAPQSSEIAIIKKAIRRVSREIELAYGGPIGSVFRSGHKQTHFAHLVHRHADLYAVSALNLLHYPHNYFFKGAIVLSPHEATVDPTSSYDPLAAYGDLADCHIELIQQSSASQMKLLGRMSSSLLGLPRNWSTGSLDSFGSSYGSSSPATSGVDVTEADEESKTQITFTAKS